jgi:hypothetical protein
MMLLEMIKYLGQFQEWMLPVNMPYMDGLNGKTLVMDGLQCLDLFLGHQTTIHI